jgi:mycofactocin system FadH/OYE family oxidoreductase 2
VTTTRYKQLFTPLRLGPVTIANRIVFSAHLTNYAEDGLPTEQHAAYYAARARGGAGLIITEEHSTHPTDWPYEKLIHGFHPEVIPGYRRITEAVHRHGTPIFAQINHNGGQASSMYTRMPVWAPSPVADPLFREVPKEVDEREIAQIVAGYALVAEHCREGGFDGIELQCSHSSIVRGFLSPATNVRTDRWGGSLENRARLLLELVSAVREAIGRDLALGVRLCGDELIEGGTTIDEAVEVAKLVEQTGQVDYLNTSIGVATQTLYMIEASMAVRPGYALFIPAALRRATRLPVVGVGRFKDAVQADRALSAGQCDMVGVVRGQIADPDFARKSRSGHSEDVRLCLSCNQECVGRMGLNRWLGCIENPRTGRESELTAPPQGMPLELSKRPKRVMVVGAGPAGLQAAIAAAQHGHLVSVYERTANVGGQVRIAASVASRAELGDLVRNQESELGRLGVPVQTNVTVDAALIKNERPEVVVIATGSEPGRPPWLPENPPIPVCDVRDVLEGKAHPTGNILLIDELAFHQSTSVAELLADRGASVELLTPGMVAAQDLGITLDLEGWNIRAASKGIKQTTDSVIMGFDDAGALSVLHHPTGSMGSKTADWIVLAVPPTAADGLYKELKAQAKDLGITLHRIGDALAPRRAHAAVIDGERIGATL